MIVREEIREEIERAEKQHGIPGGLLAALVRAESGNAQHSVVSFAAAPFDVFARRVEPGFWRTYIRGTDWEKTTWGPFPEIIAASYGLAQIMYTTALWAWRRELIEPALWDGEPWSLFRPRTNLELGAAVLAYKARRFGGWDAGVAAYNAGSARRMNDGLFVNHAYVEKVRSAWSRLDWPALEV